MKKLTLKDARYLYNNGMQEIALEYYTKQEIEAKELPESWEDLRSIGGYWIGSGSNTLKLDATEKANNEHQNVAPTKEICEAALSVIKLTQLMKVYNDGWVADWSYDIKKYIIENNAKGQLVKDFYYCHASSLLTFQTREKRDHFFKHHLDLVKKAAPILFGVSFASGEAKRVSFVEGIEETKTVTPDKEVAKEGYVILNDHLEDSSEKWENGYGSFLPIEAIVKQESFYDSQEDAKQDLGSGDFGIYKITIHKDGSHDLQKIYDNR